MDKPKSYRDLIVWQKAMAMVTSAYELSRKFPRDERFGLSLQLRRAAVSVPANIAEGFGRWHSKEYVRHLRIANGSLKELETHFQIAHNLAYLRAQETEQILGAATEVGRMLYVLIQKLEHRINS